MTGIVQTLIGAYRGAAAAVTDAYFNLVTLLLPGNGTNGAQNNTFLDSSSNNFTITRNGNTTQGTFSPFSQTGWSNYFSGSGDFLSIASNAAFDLSGVSFTIEFWVYLTENAPAHARNFINRRQTTGSFTSSYQIYTDTSSNKLKFFVSGQTILTSSQDIPVFQWVHIAVTWNGTTLRMFINGTLDSNTANYGAGSGGDAEPIKIGRLDSNDYITSYLSNLRITKSGALYTSTFTPSTTPLTTTVSAGTVSLLTCQSNRFIDNSSNAFAVTVNGTPSVQAFSPFAPTAAYDAATNGGSGYFDGTGDYLTIADNAAFAFGANPFTVEFWFYPTLGSTAQYIFDQNPNTANNASFAFQFTTGNAIEAAVFSSTTGYTITSSALPLNQWYHVAMSRSGANYSLFINGSRSGTDGTLSTNSINNSSAEVRIGNLGNSPTNSYPFKGYVSDARIVKGTAVYDPTSTTYTIPTAPLTAITNTSLLCNFTNAGITDATAKNDLETVGNAQISTTQSKFGGSSMYFDGTGDWLTVIDNPNLQMVSGDFTIEGWFYLSATGVAYGIVSKGTSTTGWSVNITSGNKLQFSYTSSNLTGATTLSSATWYYFAVVRSGTATGNLKIYLNGSADATSAGAVTDNFNQTSIMYVGADRVGTSALNGYIDDLRITKGYARTISASPTAAFSVQ